MAAPLGNRYTEKWTKEKTLELLERAFDSVNDQCYFLSEVTVAVGEYVELWSYLTEKFRDEPEVFQAIKRLYSKVESIITRKTADGDIVPALGIFILKSYHNLVETSRVQQEVSGKDGGAVQIYQLPDNGRNKPENH